jgi:secretory carrier-associated membrane protein
MDRFRKAKADGEIDGGPTGGNGFNPKMASREMELAERERALAEREMTLVQREMAVAEAETQGEKTEKNWPPCCKITHHDIAEDIPVDAQHGVKLCYLSFGMLAIGLCYSAFAAFLAAFAVDFSKITHFFVAVIIMLCGFFGGILLWYLRLYNACKYDRAGTFLFFFAMYFVHIAFCVTSAIAPPFEGDTNFYMAGIMAGIHIAKAYPGKEWLATMYFVGGGLWLLQVLLCCYVMYVTVRYYRSNDGNAKAKQEFEEKKKQAQALGATASMAAKVSSKMPSGSGRGRK